jgi:hypothetical protein
MRWKSRKRPLTARLPQIAKISGKDPSPIEMKGGVKIPRAVLHSLVGASREPRYIEHFSLEKRSSDSLVLRVVPRERFDLSSVENIQRKLNKGLGSLATVSVEVESR